MKNISRKDLIITVISVMVFAGTSFAAGEYLDHKYNKMYASAGTIEQVTKALEGLNQKIDKSNKINEMQLLKLRLKFLNKEIRSIETATETDDPAKMGAGYKDRYLDLQEEWKMVWAEINAM